jgi:hypothetical protein
MPVEIREIVIKATVDQGAPQGGGAAGGGGGSAGGGGADVLKDCVELVMEIINDKKGR